MAVQLHRRDPFLVLGHEVDGLEPHREGQLGGVEDGACGNRGLAVAAIALLELAAAQLAASVMATVGAQKPIGPSPLKERIEALVFGAVEREECVEADSFLKLYKIFALEAKDYTSTTRIPLDQFRADMDSLVVYQSRKQPSKVIPVFSITRRPAHERDWKVLKNEAVKRGIKLIDGSPDEQAIILNYLETIP